MKLQKSKQTSTVITLLFLVAFYIRANAQVYYYYDDNGNRIASSETPPEHAPKLSVKPFFSH